MARSRSGSVMSSFEKTAVRFPFRLCPHATDSTLGAVPYDVAAQEWSIPAHPARPSTRWALAVWWRHTRNGKTRNRTTKQKGPEPCGFRAS